MATAGVLDLDIVVDAADWVAALPSIEAHCRRAAAAAFGRVWRSARAAEATLVLGDDARVAGLNRDFRGIDAPTNVLSFPATVESGDIIAQRSTAGDDVGTVESPGLPPTALGDMIIAYQTAEAEARRDGMTLADHVSHLVVHGILHLLGYDHRTDSEAVVMETLETSVLAGLGVADPYAGLCDP